MSVESRLARGDNPEDVKKLFPADVDKIAAILKSMEKKGVEKKTTKKKTA